MWLLVLLLHTTTTYAGEACRRPVYLLCRLSTWADAILLLHILSSFLLLCLYKTAASGRGVAPGRRAAPSGRVASISFL